ncbi:MAG: EthD family reductase [Enhydrobacter sp.]|nr:EthD family reductase [Enhydrobacter sp.]
MVKVSVLYPASTDARFDMEYYLGKHMPPVRERSGPACRGVAVDERLAGVIPGAPATYIAMGHILYDTVEDFEKVFAEHGQALLAYIPNFTNAQPAIQISEVRL